MLAPNWLKMSLGLRVIPLLGSKKLWASVLLSKWNSYRSPWIWLVPLLICTLVVDPPARPCSGLKLAVVTLTVSIASDDGTYEVFSGTQMLYWLTPSMRTVLP